MGRVLAVANQKGGVAKTTTVHNLGSALAELGQRVLLVDLDPQACLTFSAGLNPEKLPASLHDVLVRRTAITDVIESIRHNLEIAPATIDLAGSEVILLTRTGREHVLSRALSSVRDDYDTIIIDCPPSLGVLTINGLSAADSVLIPLQCEALSHRGVGQLLETVADVRAFANDRLEVLGVIATMFDARTRHGREILNSVGEHYGLRVIEPPVPKSVRFAESAGQGQSILSHSPSSPGADAYRAIAAQLDAEIRPGIARPTALEDSGAGAP